MGFPTYKLMVVENYLLFELFFLFFNSCLLSRGFMHTLITISWFRFYKVILIVCILILVIIVLPFLIVCLTLSLVFRALILSIWVYIINFFRYHLALFIIVVKYAIVISPSVIMQIKFLLHNCNFKLINQT